jgi:hypothetical protein
MNMQTISLFEEGNGVHIVIPNTKIEEIKQMIAALLINNVGANIKESVLDVEAPVVAKEIAPTLEDINAEKEEISSKIAESEITEMVEEPVLDEKELPWNQDDTSNDSVDDTIADTIVDTINEPINEEANNDSQVSESTAVITEVPEYNEQVDDELVSSENKDVSETVYNNSNTDVSDAVNVGPVEELSESESSVPVTPNDSSDDSEMVLKISANKNADAVIGGLEATLMYAKITPEMKLSNDKTAVIINTENLDQNTKDIILRTARITRNFDM